MRLAGKKTLVTGAASGIGKAVVAAFLREGAEVIGADKDFPVAGSAIGGGATAVCLDVSKESDWERLFQEVILLDVLVACAGISEAKPIPETSLADWRRVMGVNLDGAFLSVKYGVKAMQANRGGAIVLVSSASGIKASAGASAYCASKAGLRMLAKTAALEFKSQAIRVNCVSPGGSSRRCGKKSRFGKRLSKSTEARKVRGMPWAALTPLDHRYNGWHFQKKSRPRSSF